MPPSTQKAAQTTTQQTDRYKWVVLSAGMSWLRGGKYHYHEETEVPVPVKAA
jgi:hypothetical protein